MKVAVIGGAGRMGLWLIEYLTSLGHSVVVSDPRSHQADILLASPKVIIANSNVYAAKDADVVFISVPIENTIEVINEVVHHMRKSSVLCEISSVKGRTPLALKESVVHGVQPLCIHPMFGPGASSQSKKIVLIPVVDPVAELELVQRLFPGCHVITTTPATHDRAMALTISLPYFVNMVLASVLADEDLSLLQQLGGTTFAVQLLVTGSVMSNSPDLHRALHMMNSHSLGILKKFEVSFQRSLARLVRNSDEFEESYRTLQEALEPSVNPTQKYSEMYHLLELMDRTTASEAGPQ